MRAGAHLGFTGGASGLDHDAFRVFCWSCLEASGIVHDSFRVF